MKAVRVLLAVAALSLQAQPRVQGFTLPNGLQVLLLEDHEHPLVRVRLFLRLEPGALPAGQQGLPQLFQCLFDHAETADLKAGELDRILDASGIQLTQCAEPDGFAWRLLARSRDQDRAMGLLADRLLRTLLDPDLLEAQRLPCQRQVDPPWEAPLVRLRQILTQELASRPASNSLRAITLQDLLDFRARVVRPDRAILILHGDLGLEQAKRLVLLSLGPWTAQPSPAPGKPLPRAGSPPPPAAPVKIPPPPLPGTRTLVMALAPRPDDLAQEPVELLKLLVPGEASLLPVRVTMEAIGLVATLNGEGNPPKVRPESLVRERLAAFRQKGFLQADLDRARAAWAARRSLDSLHPEAQMDRALAEALGHGADEDRMRTLSLEALNAALRNWLEPTKLRIGALSESGDPIALPGGQSK